MGFGLMISLHENAWWWQFWLIYCFECHGCSQIKTSILLQQNVVIFSKINACYIPVIIELLNIIHKCSLTEEHEINQTINSGSDHDLAFIKAILSKTTCYPLPVDCMGEGVCRWFLFKVQSGKKREKSVLLTLFC